MKTNVANQQSRRRWLYELRKDHHGRMFPKGIDFDWALEEVVLVWILLEMPEKSKRNKSKRKKNYQNDYDEDDYEDELERRKHKKKKPRKNKGGGSDRDDWEDPALDDEDFENSRQQIYDSTHAYNKKNRREN